MFGLRDCQIFGIWIELVRVGIEISAGHAEIGDSRVVSFLKGILRVSYCLFEERD